MVVKKTVKGSKTGPSKPGGKSIGPEDKTASGADDSSSMSKEGQPGDAGGKVSNEERLLKDVEDELQPLTSFLSESAEKLRTELDKKGEETADQKGTSKAKKRRPA